MGIANNSTFSSLTLLASSVFLEKYDIDGSMTKQVQYAAQTQLYFLSLVQNKTDQFLLVNEFDAASYTVLTTIFSADLTELQMIKFCTSIYCPYSPFAIVYVQDYSLFTYATTTISDVTFHIARVNLFETETSRQNSVFKVICDTNMPRSMSKPPHAYATRSPRFPRTALSPPLPAASRRKSARHAGP